MLSTMLVLAAIMGVVNISNYREMLKCADEMTELLAQNDGKFPEGPLPVEADKKVNTLQGMKNLQTLRLRNRREIKTTRVVFRQRLHLKPDISW